MTHVGALQLGDRLLLSEVYFVPGLAFNLVSVRHTPLPYAWSFTAAQAKCVVLGSSLDLILTANLSNNLYQIEDVRPSTHVLSAVADPAVALRTWHERLGHLGLNGVMQLFRLGRLVQSEILNAVTAADISSFECKSCIIGKGKRLPQGGVLSLPTSSFIDI